MTAEQHDLIALADLEPDLVQYFPERLRREYRDLIGEHRLRHVPYEVRGWGNEKVPMSVRQFLRCLWAFITNRMAKMNATFNKNDPTRLIATIESFFQIHVDHYVSIDFCVFKDLVNALGGITIPFDRPLRIECADGELFSPALLRVTLVGIALASIPLVAAWSAGRWLTPWADSVGGATNPGYKADTQAAWAFGAALGSFAGGQVASLLGRRLTYFLISLFSTALTVGIFMFLKPLEPAFLPMVFIQGLIATLFFGWLPLCLPELFPTRVRASGAGLSYNFGRFLVAGAVLAAGALTSAFGGDYAKAGAIMGTIYALGMVVIWFAPDTTGKKLED